MQNVCRGLKAPGRHKALSLIAVTRFFISQSRQHLLRYDDLSIQISVQSTRCLKPAENTPQVCAVGSLHV